MQPGDRFGRLVLLEKAETDAHYNVKWRCRCDCGRKTLVYRQHLRSGRSTSCGCRRSEVTAARNWKGDEASYSALHKWIATQKEKAGACSHCGERRRTHWANIDHRYRRELEDWIELCSPCHWKHDQATKIIGSMG